MPDSIESGEFSPVREDLILSGVTLWGPPELIPVLGEVFSNGDTSSAPSGKILTSFKAGAMSPGSADEKAFTAG